MANRYFSSPRTVDYERTGLKEGQVSRLFPKDTVPAFDPRACGTPQHWDQVMQPLISREGMARQRGFEPVEGNFVDVERILDFLALRLDPLGYPVSKLLEPMSGDNRHWFRYRIKSAEDPAKAQGIRWKRAWRGCKLEAVYIILYHNSLNIIGDTANTDWITVYPDRHIAGNHQMQFVPLCRDGVLWAPLLELAIDDSDETHAAADGESWTLPQQCVHLQAIWFVGCRYQDVPAGWRVSEVWDPIMEANPQSKPTMSNDFYELLRGGLFADVIIKCKDSQLKAHRAILAARSEYFRTLFRSSFRETAPGGSLANEMNSGSLEQCVEIDIPDCDACDFSLLLEWFYTSRINPLLHSEEICALLCLSNKYLVPELKELCADTLSERIMVSNVLSLLEVAMRLNLANLQCGCLDFVTANVKQVSQHEGYESCSPHVLKTLTSHVGKEAFRVKRRRTA